MAFTAKTVDEQNISAQQDRGLIGAWRDGILYGINISATSSTISIGSGMMIAGGCVLQNDGIITISSAASASHPKARLIAQVVINGSTQTVTVAEQISSSASAHSYSSLTQNDIKSYNSGTYQVELCKYTKSGSTITFDKKIPVALPLTYGYEDPTASGAKEGELYLKTDVRTDLDWSGARLKIYNGSSWKDIYSPVLVSGTTPTAYNRQQGDICVVVNADQPTPTAYFMVFVGSAWVRVGG